MLELAREFADVLFGASFETIIPFKTYEALQQAVLAGEVDAAWGPPLVCARVEAAGGMVALRAVRHGEVTYRSVLLVRVQDQYELAALRTGEARPRAVWVDASSMGGYLLPRAHLRKAGIDPATAFLTERMLGSYTACFDAVLDADADLTASFLGKTELETMWGDKMRRLRPLAYSDEVPNDGVVLAPGLSSAQRAALVGNLRKLLANARSHDVLCSVFTVTGFEQPPPGTYAPVLQFA
ncbi:MAG: PhnD/SsuA/transferrin family substrate-binding protein [Myxococcales bacterium]|nr:PhnD/SsuA/transferrin family substrate-binding protein [Myxococcales bacterium]